MSELVAGARPSVDPAPQIAGVLPSGRSVSVGCPPGPQMAETVGPVDLCARGRQNATSEPTGLSAPTPCKGFPRDHECDLDAWCKGYCRRCYPRWRRHEIAVGAWLGQRKVPSGVGGLLATDSLRAMRDWRKRHGSWPSGAQLLAQCRSKDGRRSMALGLHELLDRGIISYQLVPVGLFRR